MIMLYYPKSKRESKILIIIHCNLSVRNGFFVIWMDIGKSYDAFPETFSAGYLNSPSLTGTGHRR
ncbi:MAG: hypothetical protein LBJ72_02710 [Dysgonamonadaceae bacterium]|jgi:hypothetical protein|nr:hypothetical protein [Dysgonamonadaceae bacterium]